MKALHKYELAQYAGVTIDTMKKYIKAMLKHEAFSDYNIRSKILTPKQVAVLCDHYGIIIE